VRNVPWEKEKKRNPEEGVGKESAATYTISVIGPKESKRKDLQKGLSFGKKKSRSRRNSKKKDSREPMEGKRRGSAQHRRGKGRKRSPSNFRDKRGTW